MIPAVNGKYCETDDEFVMPARYSTSGIFPGADSVFSGRMRLIGAYEMVKDGSEVVEAETDEDMAPEAYELRLGRDGAKIRSRDERGYNYALTTLFQMLALGRGRCRACEIADEPGLEQRGTMLDVCRHFFSAEEVKKIIEQCALLKMNHFHWHLSEDQGFRIQSDRFPKLNEIGSFRKLSPQDPAVLAGLAKPLERYGGYYTREEIRDVVEFAARRQIEVIPEIDLPGHCSAILAAYPEFTCSGDALSVKNTFGVFERIFCAGNEGAYRFLYELLDEVMELFPSRYIHLGGDEAPKTVWHDCPKCNRLMKEKGIKNYEQLQAYFTAQMIAHVKRRGKIPVVWNESAASGMLDDAAVVQYWSEMAPGRSYMLPELEKGRKILISSGDQFYCSSSYADIPLRATLLYEPNVKGEPVPEECVLGVEAPMWTEWCATEAEIEKQMYPRLLAVAERGWTRVRSVENFLGRAVEYLNCPVLNKLQALDWEAATVHGEEAVRQVVTGLLTMGGRYRSMTSGDDLEETGKAEAITPDGSEKAEPSDMIRMFVTNKMQAAYTREEIERAVGMVMEAMTERVQEKEE